MTNKDMNYQCGTCGNWEATVTDMVTHERTDPVCMARVIDQEREIYDFNNEDASNSANYKKYKSFEEYLKERIRRSNLIFDMDNIQSYVISKYLRENK